jgi:hypothetical protein
MAVRTLFGDNGRGLQQAVPPRLAFPGNYKGRVRQIVDRVDLPNPTNIASTIFIGSVHSAAVINPSSTIWFAAGGAGVTLDIGDVLDPDGLATVISIAAAGSSPILEAMASSLFARRLWQHLGYAADPNRELDLFATVQGANMAAANMFLSWSLLYSVD